MMKSFSSLLLLIAAGLVFMSHHPRSFVSALERREAINKQDAARMHREANQDEESDADDDEPFIIAGYLPDYRDYININAAAMHLSDIMIFSVTPKTIMKYAATYEAFLETVAWQGDEYSLMPQRKKSPPPPGGCCLSQEHYDKIKAAQKYKRKHQQKDVRLLATVGGGGRSDGFRGIINGGRNIQNKFITGLLMLCYDEDLDGIDFNYDGIRTLADWKAYIEFLLIAQNQLHNQGMLISVALHPGQVMPSADVCKSFDRLHIMTYDMSNINVNKKRGKSTNNKQNTKQQQSTHHASFDKAKDAIEEYIEKSCPPEKLIMGIPAYGRHEKDPGQVKTYSEMVDESVYYNSLSNKDVLKELQTIKKWEGYEFDSPMDVQKKVLYAQQRGLGGVFFWELGQDKQLEGVANGGVLLKAAASAVDSTSSSRKGTSSSRKGTSSPSKGTSSSSTEQYCTEDGYCQQEEDEFDYF